MAWARMYPPPANHTESPDMSNTTPLAALYQTVIQEELGLVARVDDEGDVVFRHPDLGTMFFSLSEGDPEFMRLIYPGFVDADDLKITRAELQDVVNTVNYRCKGVKLSIPQEGAAAGRVSGSIESFIAGPDRLPDEALLRAIIARCMSAIRHGVGELLKETIERKQAGAQAAQ